MVAAGVAVAAGDDFLDGAVVVHARDGLDAEAAVAVFEGAAVDETDQRADGGLALKVGDVDAFDAADGFRELEDFLQGFQARAVVLEEYFRLDRAVRSDAGTF